MCNNHFKISTTISLVNIFSIHTASHVKLTESITKQMVCYNINNQLHATVTVY